MKKLIASLIVASSMFLMATPVMASNCQPVKVTFPGFAMSKFVCINPTSPVNVTVVATSTSTNGGSSVAIAKSIVISGGNVSVTTIAISSSH